METPLYTALTDYQKKKYASFHTPGHKKYNKFFRNIIYTIWILRNCRTPTAYLKRRAVF